MTRSKKDLPYIPLKPIKPPRKSRINRPKPTIAVDWDGTLWDNSREEFLPGALDALRQLCNYATVIIHSCRGTYYEGAVWIKGRLADENIFVEIWTAPGKPLADIYIDDRALRFITWEVTLNELRDQNFLR